MEFVFRNRLHMAKLRQKKESKQLHWFGGGVIRGQCSKYVCLNKQSPKNNMPELGNNNMAAIRSLNHFFPMIFLSFHWFSYDFQHCNIARNSQLRWVLFESPSSERWYLQCQLQSPRRRRHSSRRMEKKHMRKCRWNNLGTRVWLECGHTSGIKIYDIQLISIDMIV